WTASSRTREGTDRVPLLGDRLHGDGHGDLRRHGAIAGRGNELIRPWFCEAGRHHCLTIRDWDGARRLERHFRGTAVLHPAHGQAGGAWTAAGGIPLPFARAPP